jgi:hypothetical protein
MSAADKTKLNNTPVIFVQNSLGGHDPVHDDQLEFKFEAPFSAASQRSGTPGALRTTEVVSLPDATPTSPGAMSAADKIKLNSVIDMAIVTGSLATSRTIAPNDAAALTYNLPSKRQCLYATPLSLSFPGHSAISAVMPIFETQDGVAYITGIKVSLTNVGSASIKITAGSDMPILLLG